MNLNTGSHFDLWIGADQYGYSRDYLTGKIDELRFWIRALSETEIQQLYNMR